MHECWKEKERREDEWAPKREKMTRRLTRNKTRERERWADIQAPNRVRERRKERTLRGKRAPKGEQTAFIPKEATLHVQIPLFKEYFMCNVMKMNTRPYHMVSIKLAPQERCLKQIIKEHLISVVCWVLVKVHKTCPNSAKELNKDLLVWIS